MNIHYYSIYIYIVSKMYLPCTLYANNISTLFFDSDMKIKVRTVYSAIDYDIKMGSYRRKIILIECNAKCHFLKNVPLKVGTNENGSACGRWLSIGI